MSMGLEKLLLTNEIHKENEGNWFFSWDAVKTKTPSRQQGMGYDEELKLRRDAVRFMKNLANAAYEEKYRRKYFSTCIVKVLATSTVWLHRFFMIHPFQLFDRYDVAAACFYLASKAEDQPLNLSVMSIHCVEILERLGVGVGRSAEEIETSSIFYSFLFVDGVEKNIVEGNLGTTFCVRIHPRKLAIIFITWACNQEGFALNNWKHKAASSKMTHWLQAFNLKEEEVESLLEEHTEHLRLDNAEKEQLKKNELRRARFNPTPTTSVHTILAELRQEPIVDKNANFQFDFNVQKNNGVTF
ncbi:unnamed protein product [Allacma fusca]|uniref:Uncharacterized protein n=1 Tax=Allacma fusca TaxID=39272 RepID=A0A8J2NZ68_9HEXA|nr:unnamed protein product [Allacma fusca]